MPFDKLRSALATSSGRIDKQGSAGLGLSILSPAPPAAIVRIQTNVGLLRQADAIVTVTTTKTIIREHETDLVVREARTVAADVVVLSLADPQGAELPPWTPGAHIDLILGDDLTRQYSLCAAARQNPMSGAWACCARRQPRQLGTRACRPQSRSTVRVRGPRNHFPLVASSRYLFIAGGIGITPILPMIAEAEAAAAGLAAVLRRPRTGVDGLRRRTRLVRRPGDDRAAGRDGHA